MLHKYYVKAWSDRTTTRKLKPVTHKVTKKRGATVARAEGSKVTLKPAASLTQAKRCRQEPCTAPGASHREVATRMRAMNPFQIFYGLLSICLTGPTGLHMPAHACTHAHTHLHMHTPKQNSFDKERGARVIEAVTARQMVRPGEYH